MKKASQVGDAEQRGFMMGSGEPEHMRPTKVDKFKENAVKRRTLRGRRVVLATDKCFAKLKLMSRNRYRTVLVLREVLCLETGLSLSSCGKLGDHDIQAVFENESVRTRRLDWLQVRQKGKGSIIDGRNIQIRPTSFISSFPEDESSCQK